MPKYFKKIQKDHFRTILGSLCPNLGKNKFSWRNLLCQFLNIQVICHCAKNQKNSMTKNAKLTDRQTN